jgi:hypothetical protein
VQENMHSTIRFPQRLPHPNYNVFLRLVNSAQDTRSLVPTRQESGGPPREARTPETEDTQESGQISCDSDLLHRSCMFHFLLRFLR